MNFVCILKNTIILILQQYLTIIQLTRKQFHFITSHPVGLLLAMDDLSSSVRDKLKDLFTSIDSDRSGEISIEEFQEACYRLSLKVTDEEIKEFISADVSGDKCLDFKEFCQFYILSLRRVFRAIDNDSSGQISARELKLAFDQLGQSCTERELKLLLSQVDKDSNGAVDFQEFCDYFISLPSPSVKAIMEQWSSGLSIDIGTDLAPPHLPPPSLTIWRALFAGGVAGVVSRTSTAPLEKIKLLAQVSRQLSVYFS